MAAPTPATRRTPGGRMLGDGFPTTVVVSTDTDYEFTEMSVTPPGMEADEPNDISTQYNVRWHTYRINHLVKLSPISMSGLWDPVIYSSLKTIIGVNCTITVLFPDGSSLAFYGLIQSFKPSALKYKTVPEASLTIFPTNTDPSDCSEQEPVYTAGLGTGCH